MDGLANWQTIDETTLLFPAEMLIDYVRVYQRKDEVNVGCDPKDYPTADYIASHIDAYRGEFCRLEEREKKLMCWTFVDRNMTEWPYAKPRNSLYDGSC